jgi:hypothetical protein
MAFRKGVRTQYPNKPKGASQLQKRGQDPIAKWPQGCSALLVQVQKRGLEPIAKRPEGCSALLVQVQKRGQEPIAKWPGGCSALLVPDPFSELPLFSTPVYRKLRVFWYFPRHARCSNTAQRLPVTANGFPRLCAPNPATRCCCVNTGRTVASKSTQTCGSDRHNFF